MTRDGSRLRSTFKLVDGRVWLDDRAITLTPTLFAMLRHFVLNPGRLITKQELLDHVWPETHVTEDLVKDYVRKIRRVLGDDAKRPRFIETARGMGYRFVGDIAPCGADGMVRAEPAARHSVPTVAVLPFADLSADGDQTYLSIGIAQDIIAELARFRSLVVIARDSSFLYAPRPARAERVAHDLGAQYLVGGSVCRAGERMRLHVRLTEAASDACVWSERYDRALGDIFAMQQEISGAVVSTLIGHLEEFGRRRAARKLPRSLRVYELLLLGEWHARQGSKAEVIEARRMFHRAIGLEPSNARAHAELAFSHLVEFWSTWTTAPVAAIEQTFDLARKATILDPLDSRAHVYLAVAYHYGQGNFAAAERAFDKAIQLNPNDYDAFCLRSWLLALSGRSTQAVACAEQAIRLSPLTTEDCRAAQCIAAYSARRYEAALSTIDKSGAPTPEFHAYRAMCCAQLGRGAEAEAAMTDYLAGARQAMTDFPGTDREHWRTYWATMLPFKRPQDLEHLLDGLRKAGLP